MWWSSQPLQFILCIFLCCVTSARQVIHVFGDVGSQTSIPCLYGQGYEAHEKYLCRNDCGKDADVLIRSSEAKSGKYSSHDDGQKRIFMVTITDLHPMDAGKYLCGVTKTGLDLYTLEVILKIKRSFKGWCCVKTNHMSGTVGHSFTLPCPYPPKHRDNRKFLCKGNHHDHCTNVMLSDDRFMLKDDVSSSSFLVMITKLEEGDAGMYWCGSDSQWNVGNYINIKLTIESCCATTSYLSGYVGLPITFSCPFPLKHKDNRKFLCKGNHHNNCTDVATKGNRFTLKDEMFSSSFLVMIPKLEDGDAGTYWCGSNSRWGDAIYTKMELSVEWCCVETVNVSGIIGRPITFTCPYPPKHRDNRKFICKGDVHRNCSDVVMSGNRFTLKDDVSSSSFLVMITKLEDADAGTYWCGSDNQWEVGNYTKIELTVGVTPLKVVVYIVPVLLLIIMFALIIVYNCNMRGSGTSTDRSVRKLEALEMICEIQEAAASSKSRSLTDKSAEVHECLYENVNTTEDTCSAC